MPRLSDFTPQALSNTAWAYAAVIQSDGKLFAALTSMVELRASGLKPQELVNTAWSFATVNPSDEKLFATLERET